MLEAFHDKIAGLYLQYINNIKPLIAANEALYAELPMPVINEIRAFNDHIARCYATEAAENMSDSEKQANIESNIRKAEGHIMRATLDCYKFLNLKYQDNIIKKFEDQNKHVDITLINNGDFHASFKRQKNNIYRKLKEAKFLEGNDKKDQALVIYDEVYSLFNELDDLITSVAGELFWAKTKSRSSLTFRVIKTIIILIIGAMLPIILPLQEWWSIIVAWFKG
ncbi:MAG: hypothetical protein SNG38_06370 [Rikenellaceae bacterium]